MKVVSIVGARPQFVKAAPISRALRQAGHTEILVHTGQHYDEEMSAVFFRELEIPEPDHNLGVGSGPHGAQTGQMLVRIEEVLLRERPDWVLVFGDTNSTLAGALAAVKLQIGIAHLEAGLRSRNRTMPEEHNRVLVDHCSDLLLCPTQTAVENLQNEGITNGVYLVGDPMFDAVQRFVEVAEHRSDVLARESLTPGGYLLATIHRPYNADVPENLRNILLALDEIGEPVVFPVHPRTRQRIAALGETHAEIGALRNVRAIKAVGYLDMLMLQRHARIVLTDSGGMQKEAFFLGTPCITLRPETEWIETVAAGWNVVVGSDRRRIVETARQTVTPSTKPPPFFGDGRSSEAVVRILETSIRAVRSVVMNGAASVAEVGR